MSTSETTGAVDKKAFAQYLADGIGYSHYLQNLETDLLTNTDEQIREYINLNQHRIHRVEKTYTPSTVIIEQVKKMQRKIWWLIITEHWCGDAAQTLPALNKLAELSVGKIEIRLVYRDQNPALMDAYLTNEKRSIPRLIQLDEQLNVTGTWGPRPVEAQQLVKQVKSDPAIATNYATELHLWYAKDKLNSFEPEIIELLKRVDG